MYLPDTNVLIKGAKSQEPDKSFLDKAISQEKLYLSVISIAEFLSQASNEEERKMRNLMAAFPILNIGLEVAESAAKYRKRSIKSKRMHLLDCLLAAQAKAHNLTLVTNNRADFPMKDIKIISPK